MSSYTIPDLTKIDTTKYSFYPYESERLFRLYKKQIERFWTVEEIDLTKDPTDFEELPKGVQEFIIRILAFFSQIDGFVIENINKRFQEDTSDIKEAAYFYAAQNLIEIVHNEMYALLIITLIPNHDRRTKALDAVKHYPDIRAIAEWMLKWMNPELNKLERIIAFACIEGIIFSGAFAAVYWIKHTYKDKLRGLCKSNEMISGDEQLHTEWGVEVYHYYITEKGYKPLPQKKIKNIIYNAVQLSETLMKEALPVSLLGLSSEDMLNYIKCTANNLSRSVNCDKLYIASYPSWCIMIGLENKTNFFEDTVTEYKKCNEKDWAFSIHEDF